MSIPIIETCRKRKRRPKIFGFHGFAEPGWPMSPWGAFRDNVRVFLRECAELEDYKIEGMPIWCTLLSHESKSFVIPLYTIQEDVKHSLQPYCDHCRCTGWSNHFVAKRKYHFIIPVDSEWNMPLDDGVFDLQTHLLHGLIHSNGFGHLICMNGIEGGSKTLTGREIMDLWDRICSNLRTRKITVEDLSKKRSMDLRLLYGVAYGHPWFGKWGYRFHHGSYGVTRHNYERAIEILSSLELDQIILDFRDGERNQEIKQIVYHYRGLSEGQLTTIRDLLRFLLTIKTCNLAPQKKPVLPNMAASSSVQKRSSIKKKNSPCELKSPNFKAFSTVAANMGSRWPVRRLEYAADIIVEALKEAKANKPGNGAMTRQDVRDAARMHIGDTGLLDYVLKSMNNVIVGDFVVRRAVNPTTRVLHYSIHKLGNGIMVPKQEPTMMQQEYPPRNPTLKPGVDVYSDLFFLYTNILLNYPGSESVEFATRAVLDSKHFVKEWPVHKMDRMFTFICSVAASSANLKPSMLTELPPGELVLVPLNATISELKMATENALRNTYCVLENFVVTGIETMEDAGEEELVFGKVASGSEIAVTGFGIDEESKLKYQGGCDTWMVRCECGARDDDGERMVACDVCEVWQHTRCYGIDDSETLPPLFVCSRCCDSFAQPRNSETAFGISTSKALLEGAAEDSGALIEYDDCLAMLLSPETVFLE